MGLIILAGLGYFIFVKDNPPVLQDAASGQFSVVLTPTISPTPTPISFKFSSSTDLKSELQTVDPQIKDADFDSLKKIIFDL